MSQKKNCKTYLHCIDFDFLWLKKYFYDYIKGIVNVIYNRSKVYPDHLIADQYLYTFFVPKTKFHLKLENVSADNFIKMKTTISTLLFQ